MKIVLHSSTDYYLFDEFFEKAKKYATNNIIVTKDSKYDDYYYANFEVKSLNFLPKLEQDLLKIKSSLSGFILRTIDEGVYDINIYDGYLD